MNMSFKCSEFRVQGRGNAQVEPAMAESAAPMELTFYIGPGLQTCRAYGAGDDCFVSQRH